MTSVNMSTLSPAYRSCRAALDRVMKLKTEFVQKNNENLETIYSKVTSYSWLPVVPTENFNGVQLQEAVPQLLIHMKTMKQIMFVELKSNFLADFQDSLDSLSGTLNNIVEELKDSVQVNHFVLPVDPGLVISEEEKGGDRTVSLSRDWLILKRLIDLLEYSLAVFKHFNVPYFVE